MKKFNILIIILSFLSITYKSCNGDSREACLKVCYQEEENCWKACKQNYLKCGSLQDKDCRQDYINCRKLHDCTDAANKCHSKCMD